MGYSAEGLVPELNKLGNNLLGFEIGVCRGNNIKALLDNCSNVRKIYGIDPWMAYKDSIEVSQKTADEWYRQTQELLKPYWYDDCVELVRKTSLGAVNDYPDGFFDFGWIDGNHSENMAFGDMVAWWPKVKNGGILAGHDYRKQDVDVRAAVARFSKEIMQPVTELKFHSWMFKK